MSLNVNSSTRTTRFMTPCHIYGPTVLGAKLDTTPQHADTKMTNILTLLRAQTCGAEASQRTIGSDPLAVH